MTLTDTPDEPPPAPAVEEASTPTPQEAVTTRSEERLVVSTARVPVSRVRLRKRIVTQMQTITIPVSREELVIDHEPITDARSADRSLSDVAGESLQIILHTQRPIVTMETVAVERIRVSTTTVTEDQTVTSSVAKEQIEPHENLSATTSVNGDPSLPSSDTEPGPKTQLAG